MPQPHRLVSVITAIALVLLLPAASAQPANVLAQAGLSAAGTDYVLPGEKEILDGRREITSAQRELKDAENDFRDAERKISRAQNYIAALQREMDELKSKARRATDQFTYDKYVTAYEKKVREIEQAQEDRKKFEQDQQAKVDDARAAYIGTMSKWAEKAAALSEQYQALAEDQAIAQAIAEVSKETGRRYNLGPSRRYQSLHRQLVQAASEYERGAVDLRKDGNVLLIDVRINGKPIRTMLLDTGASSISLPYLFALDLGLEASAADPIVQLQMADGKIVDATQIWLEKVQGGEFVVENCEAFILPESLHAAPALLGNSFLGNFTFEIDPERGKLILSRLKDQGD